MKKVFAVMLFVITALLICILCTRLNREQELLKLARINVAVAETRKETAEIELDNALYRQQVLGILYKDVEKKDDWKIELEEFKKLNGYEEEK